MLDNAQAWTDGNDLVKTWTWVFNSTGERMPPDMWYPGEPNHNSDPENCVEIFGGNRLNDQLCYYQGKSVCQFQSKISHTHVYNYYEMVRVYHKLNRYKLMDNVLTLLNITVS